MKRLLIVVFLVAIASTVCAAGKLVVEDSNRNIAIQGFAPDHTKDVVLTGKSQTVDMRNDLAWSAYCAADAPYKNMSSVTKTGNNKTINGAAWHTRVVNPKSAFTNFSCVGMLERQ